MENLKEHLKKRTPKLGNPERTDSLTYHFSAEL